MVTWRVSNALFQYGMHRLKPQREPVALAKELPQLRRRRVNLEWWFAHQIIVARPLFTVSKNVSKGVEKVLGQVVPV